MRIGILSDTHLGITKEPFNNETIKGFIEAINILKQKNVDLIIHAGDIFDRRTPKQEYLFLFLSHIMDIKIFAINGNHDTTKIFGKQSPLDLMEEHLNQGNFLGKRWKISKVKNYAQDEVNLIGIDYVRNEDFLRLLNKAQSELKRNHFLNILVMHQDIDTHGITKEEISKYGFDFIINGHIHNSHIEDNFLIPGSTSLVRFDKTEFGPKYVWIWENGRVVKIQLPNQHMGKYIELDLRNKNPIEIAQSLDSITNTDEILYIHLKLSQRIDLSRYLKSNIKFKVELQEKNIHWSKTEKIVDAIDWVKRALKNKTKIDIEEYLNMLDEDIPPMQVLETLIKQSVKQ